MELLETKERFQPEYDKLTLELTKLRRLYTEAKKKHSKMELKDLELYYELEDLSKKLTEDTKLDEENEKKYIENWFYKLSLRIPFSCGFTLSLFILFRLLSKGSFITQTLSSIVLIIGHLSTGIIIGIGIYALSKKKYKSILKERYKQTEIHQKYSEKHFDKMLEVMRKKDDYNKYHQEYLKVKDEFIKLERQFLSKQEELKQFKEKVFEILFPNEREDLDKSEKIIIKENNSNCDMCYYKEPTTCKKILKKY